MGLQGSRRTAALLIGVLVTVTVPAFARKPAEKLPDRWWDAPSCIEKFVQSSTPAVSTVRLNSKEKIATYRIRWLKIQRRLNGVKVNVPYVVPCRYECVIGPGQQVEIPILAEDFPEPEIYDEAQRVDLGCEEVKTPAQKK